MRPMPARRVALLAFPRVQAIDVFGPLEVFSAADRLAGGGQYATELVAPRADEVTTSSGVRLLPHRAVASCRGPLDTLIVAGGDGVRAALEDARLVRWIARAADR